VIYLNPSSIAAFVTVFVAFSNYFPDLASSKFSALAALLAASLAALGSFEDRMSSNV
jgi:hypothetical protein